MNNAIPSKAGIINNNVNLATTKLSSFLNKLLHILRIQNIAHNGQSAAGPGSIDGVSDRIGLVCKRD